MYRTFLLGAFLLMLLTGCGYHTAASSAHLPKSVSTIAVPVFQNNTQSYHTDLSFTQAVIKEITSRTPYTIVNADKGTNADADATIHGAISSFQIIPLTYNSQTGQSSSFLVTVIAAVTVNDRDGRVLYENKNYTFRQQYQTTTDLTSFIQEDPAAVARLSRDFAQALVSDMLDSF